MRHFPPWLLTILVATRQNVDALAGKMLSPMGQIAAGGGLTPEQVQGSVARFGAGHIIKQYETILAGERVI
jgi:hypothetical protein